MLQPKRLKFAKAFRGRRRGVTPRGYNLAFGDFGLKATEVGWVASNQIEAARRAITHGLRKGGRTWVRIFPDKPVSSRAAGKRMGGGKGDVSEYVAVVRPGRIMFEIAGATQEIARKSLRAASNKLPIATRIVSKEG
jgi:large subunit ribosomal protein L16